MNIVDTYKKQIDCPEHPGQMHATLFVFPHPDAGVWECPRSGSSDVCKHPESELDNGIDVCASCGSELET